MEAKTRITRIMLIKTLVVFLMVVAGSQFSDAHGGNTHGKKEKRKQTAITQNEKRTFIKINGNYIKQVKPIFVMKCLDCHGVGNRLPWYFRLPLAKQIMEYDMSEAKKHMDMSKDFPFTGHGTPLEDLVGLAEVVNGGDMPPWQYKLIHWRSSLTQNEKLVVLKWIKDSRALLNGN